MPSCTAEGINRMAAVMAARAIGVKRNDVVLLYMPMILEERCSRQCSPARGSATRFIGRVRRLGALEDTGGTHQRRKAGADRLTADVVALCPAAEVIDYPRRSSDEALS